MALGEELRSVVRGEVRGHRVPAVGNDACAVFGCHAVEAIDEATDPWGLTIDVDIVGGRGGASANERRTAQRKRPSGRYDDARACCQRQQSLMIIRTARNQRRIPRPRARSRCGLVTDQTKPISVAPSECDPETATTVLRQVARNQTACEAARAIENDVVRPPHLHLHGTCREHERNQAHTRSPGSFQNDLVI